jgi:hypothetical protein
MLYVISWRRRSRVQSLAEIYLILMSAFQLRQSVRADGIQTGAGTPDVTVQPQSRRQDTNAYENNTDRI